MLINFDGKSALVTGAAQGIGRAIADALAAAGARVATADIAAHAGGHVVDVGDPASVQALVRAVGPVDILVNCAGGVRGQVGRPLEEVSLDDWRAIQDANLTGAFLCAQAVVPGMKAAGGGRIVNISSGAGLRVSLTGIQSYAAAKAGLIGLTRQLSHELGQFGITVNAIAPGFIRSNPTTEKQWESYGPEGQKALVQRIALRRLGAPADIANAVLFFASDLAGWITGETLSVDGGR